LAIVDLRYSGLTRPYSTTPGQTVHKIIHETLSS